MSKYDYESILDLDSKKHEVGEIVKYTNPLKTKLKIKNTKLSIKPGETKYLVKTEDSWEFKNES